MVDTGLPRSPRLVAEALGTESIPAELAVILAEHSRTVHKDGSACMPEERRGRGLHASLSHIVLGEVPVPGLECVTLISVNKDGRVHLMQSLFSICVDVYSTEYFLFACLGELTAEGLPPVMEILPDFFVAQRSVYAVPRMDHIAHLCRIPLAIGRRSHTSGTRRRQGQNT